VGVWGLANRLVGCSRSGLMGNHETGTALAVAGGGWRVAGCGWPQEKWIDHNMNPRAGRGVFWLIQNRRFGSRDKDKGLELYHRILWVLNPLNYDPPSLS
jgi:hypothetical protein